VWTCAAKRYKAEERKTRQTWAAMQKVADSITPQERASALRSANTKRRHDMRCYHWYSLCSRQRLLAVSMLGYGLRIDSAIIVACCSCLGYTKMTAAHWHNNALLCARCWRRANQGALNSLGIFGAGTAIKCRHCRAVRKDGDVFFSTAVFDDAKLRFVRIYLCDKHAKKKSWLFSAPNYHSLSTVDVGIKAKWGALRNWNGARNYARSVFDEDAAERDAEMDAEALKMAERLLGRRAFTDDADEDGDDGGVVGTGLLLAADETPGAKPPAATPKSDKKRRRIGADRTQVRALV